MSASLIARIERLERRQSNRPMPRVVLRLRLSDDDDVVGYEGNGIVTLRAADEPLEQCCNRSFEHSGAVTLVTMLSPDGHRAALEHETGVDRRLSLP